MCNKSEEEQELIASNTYIYTHAHKSNAICRGKKDSTTLVHRHDHITRSLLPLSVLFTIYSMPLNFVHSSIYTLVSDTAQTNHHRHHGSWSKLPTVLIGIYPKKYHTILVHTRKDKNAVIISCSNGHLIFRLLSIFLRH